jgi:hypothetical protein
VRTFSRSAFTLVVAVLVSLVTIQGAEAVKLEKFKNCDAVHKKYPHGIAKIGYKNKGGAVKGKPFVNTKLYAFQSKALDRDKDGVACEA